MRKAILDESSPQNALQSHELSKYLLLEATKFWSSSLGNNNKQIQCFIYVVQLEVKVVL